ncbi:MAG: hypothetical protein Q9207_001010 [Kuettlingeria erythrocarpa]
MHEKSYTTDVFRMTTKLLELNPEYYTIWNHRRRLMRSFFPGGTSHCPNEVQPLDESTVAETVRQYIADDLTFLLPLLRKFPKCYWIWNYRLWLLDEASRLPSSTAHDIWRKELGLVGKMLSLDSRNFHGWGYRRKVVSQLERLSTEADPSTVSMTEDEFGYTTKMIESNLSNFSAWHRRSKLIPKLLEEKVVDHTGRRDFLDKELELIQRALWADPDSKDQSLWFYHQYLIGNFGPESGKDSIVPDLSIEDRLTYIKAQIEDLKDMLDGAETCKWIYQRLIDLALMSKSLNEHWPVESSEVASWIENLAELDPLRKGRWDDLKSRFNR